MSDSLMDMIAGKTTRHQVTSIIRVDKSIEVSCCARSYGECVDTEFGDYIEVTYNILLETSSDPIYLTNKVHYHLKCFEKQLDEKSSIVS